MSVPGLLSVLRHSVSAIESYQLRQRYQTTVNRLSEFASTRSETIRTPIESDLRDLVEIHETLEPSTWPPDTRRLAADFGVSPLLGLVAAQEIKFLLGRFIDDPIGARNQLDALRQGLEQLYARSKSALGSLGPLAEKYGREEMTAVPSISIVFSREAAIKTFDDFANQGKEWKIILGGLGRIHGVAADSVQFSRFSQGSLVATLTVDPNVAVVIAGGFVVSVAKAVQLVSEAYLNMVKAEAFEKSMPTAPPSLGAAIDEMKAIERENLKEKAVDFVAEGNVPESDKHEATNAVVQSLARLLNFFEKGGRVQVLLESDDGAKVVAQISKTYGEIQRIESQAVEKPSFPRPGDERGR